MSEPEENQIKRLVQGYIEEELKAPPVVRAKQKLMKAFDQRPWFLTQKPMVLVPALSMMAVFAFLFYAYFLRPTSESIVPAPSSAVTIPLPIDSEKEKMVAAGRPSVVIRHLSSEIGSPMVYQMMQGGKPMTVIWVFETKI